MLSIHNLNIEDLPLIYNLGDKLFSSDEYTTLHRMWNEAEVVGHFSEDWEYCFVAKDGKKLVGFILCTLIEKPKNSWKYGHIAWLGIHTDYQGKKVADKLLTKASKLLKEKGARILVVDTTSENNKAIKFFEKNGFDEKVAHLYMYKNIDE